MNRAIAVSLHFVRLSVALLLSFLAATLLCTVIERFPNFIPENPYDSAVVHFVRAYKLTALGASAQYVLFVIPTLAVLLIRRTDLGALKTRSYLIYGVCLATFPWIILTIVNLVIRGDYAFFELEGVRYIDRGRYTLAGIIAEVLLFAQIGVSGASAGLVFGAVMKFRRHWLSALFEKQQG
jgi:hypothetical protein